ncbi:MAG: tetratricopeptide repeat protein [Gemmataceae bacterium]
MLGMGNWARDGERFLGLLGGGLMGVVLLTTPALAQAPPDQAAAALLNSARRAYNEKQVDFAIQRFREFLQKFGSHPEAASARYGLALALLDSPTPNYQEARALLQDLAGNKNLPEHPSIVYYLGVAIRGQGVQELQLADAKPQEAPQRLTTAQQRFQEAASQFASASAAYAALVKEAPPAPQELPVEWEWAARARCDQAEMELRAGKTKEALATSAPFLKDPSWTRSRYRDLGRYYHGYAAFLLHDYPTAEMTLSQLAPFRDPTFGTHARYLLARAHHLADERGEASVHYQGVLADYDKNKQDALEALKRPDLLQKDPVEKARVEALAKGPPPDHVGRASFHYGVLLYEGERFGEAQARFAELPKTYPTSPLLPEAQLRVGFCQVQLKDYAEALKTLEPLAQKEPRLADQALLWIGKARVGAAPEPANQQAYEQALRAAIDTFRQGADRAQQMTSSDPSARERRGECLLEMADTLQLLKQHKEAAQVYTQIQNDKLLPQRVEEIAYRRITALHLAGSHDEADNDCRQFIAAYPKSTLLPHVLFRYAENNFFRTVAAEKNPNLPNRAAELARLNDETIKRYQELVTKYPEFGQIPLARYGIGLAHYRKGEYDQARQALEAIPATERHGELTIVAYVLADCLIRLTPSTTPEDALAAGQLEDRLKSAVALLDTFIGAAPNAAETPDALLKLGHCQQRMAELLIEPAEQKKMLAAARAAYEKLMQPPYAKHPAHAQAVFERAKCLAQGGDLGGATNELRRFTADPWQQSAVAPMALVHLATLLRRQNQAGPAVEVLAQARQRYESALANDPARAAWVPLLRYHHGLALREAGKLPEARAVFDQIIQQAPNSPEAPEAALRRGQCLLAEGLQQQQAADKARTAATTPEQQAAAAKLREDALKTLRDAVQFLEAQAQQLRQKQPDLETRARMQYEIAWGYRYLAQPEIHEALIKAQEELAKNLKLEIGKDPLPPVAVTQIAVQPSEQKARAQYQALIADFPDLPLAAEAAFELAELFGQRNEHDQAIQFLLESLDREPPAELTDKIRIRLGASYAAKGEIEAALAQFTVVAQNPKNPLAAQAHYRAGECLLQGKQWAEAAKRLSLFRDHPQFQNVAGVSDRALLRLGHAYAQLNDWNQSRQAYETMVGRFGNSLWVHEARFGIGWAWQQQKQYDQAVNAYSQVTANTLTETAAKAQLQIGRCRLEQKRYPEACAALLVVPFTYDFPELSAVALLEAARCCGEQGQSQQAERLLERVLRDYPNTEWADAARARLNSLKAG